MKRLTFEGNFCDIAQCRELPCKYDGNCTQKEVWERLKAYEDSGCEPEEVLPKDKADEIALNLMRLADLESLCSYDHLRELAEADKDGRVVVLPCKVGDRVYIPDIESKTVANVRVQGISITSKSRVVLHFGGHPVESAWGDRCGIDWFITIEEAEKALQEMEGKKDG